MITINKHLLLTAAVFTFACMPVSIAQNTDDATDTTETVKTDKKKKAELAAVPAAIKKMKFFNAKPSTKADYYIYLQSASWCPPCNKEMPDIVKQHKIMKSSGKVELILVGADQDKESAQKFLKQYKAKFAGILSSSKGVDKLPGFTKASGIPNAIIVNANGEVLTQGHGSIISEGKWKEYTIKKGTPHDDE